MKPINNSTKSAFDNLFSQLLASLQEERELRSTASPHVALIEVKDRLHSLRSELATARKQLAPATSQRTGEVTRPESRRRSAQHSPGSSGRPTDERVQLISMLHQPRAEESLARSSSRRP